MRENPASDAATWLTRSHLTSEESAEKHGAVAVADRISDDAHSSSHAAENPAATVGNERKSIRVGLCDLQAGASADRYSCSHPVVSEPLLAVIDAAKLLRIPPKTLQAKAATRDYSRHPDWQRARAFGS